jgi:endonuclease/exonuclease/phosphatase family metal-dependent hydrolase
MLDVNGYRLLAVAAPRAVVSAELKDIRQDALAMKRQARAELQQRRSRPQPQPQPQPFALPGLSALISRLLGWLSPSPPAPPAAPSGGKTEFVVSSFNILGSQHTRGGKGGYASGVTRTGWALELLRQKRVDVVGFQEMQADQAREFQRLGGKEYGLYPGNTLRPNDVQNSIAWRKDTWDLVKGENHLMPFLDGMQRGNPVVLLRHKQTGEQVYVINVHNAPRRQGGDQQQGQRDRATDMQVALINRLKRTGIPVILTGDMNEKQNYLRRMTQEADMTSANFGPIRKLPQRTGIDWIFGSDGVRFEAFHRETQGLADKVTDHPVLFSRATI